MKKDRQNNNLFWALAGVDALIISLCTPSEQRKYLLLGVGVLLPALIGLFTSCVGFEYIFTSSFDIVLASVVWSMVILILDMTVVRDRGLNLGMLTRIALAIVVSFLLSMPIELIVFQESIDQKIVLKRDSLKKQYIRNIEFNIAALRDSLRFLDREESELKAKLSREVGGVGYSGKIGYGTVATHINEELAHLKSKNEQWRKYWSRQISLDSVKLQNTAMLIEKTYPNDLLNRIAILHELANSNASVNWTIWLIRALLILIELIPISVKYGLCRNDEYHRILETQQEFNVLLEVSRTKAHTETTIAEESETLLKKHLETILEAKKAQMVTSKQKFDAKMNALKQAVIDKKAWEDFLLQLELDSIFVGKLKFSGEKLFEEYINNIQRFEITNN
jgi:Domain of unknown function (DUF4407)